MSPPWIFINVSDATTFSKPLAKLEFWKFSLQIHDCSLVSLMQQTNTLSHFLLPRACCMFHLKMTSIDTDSQQSFFIIIIIIILFKIKPSHAQSKNDIFSLSRHTNSCVDFSLGQSSGIKCGVFRCIWTLKQAPALKRVGAFMIQDCLRFYKLKSQQLIHNLIP